MKTKRILTFLLALILIFSLTMPTVVFADENDIEHQIDQLEEEPEEPAQEPIQQEEEPEEPVQ